MIYMDNSATTPIHPDVLETMLPYLKEEFGNPSSKYYTVASRAQQAVEDARQKVAELLNCSSDEVIFTSGSTESNNMILKGVIEYYKLNRPSIITTAVEHPSILRPCEYLEERGVSIYYTDLDQYGRVEPSSYQVLLNHKPSLVSIMWGNNELGSLNDIATLSDLSRRSKIKFHTDATQVIGKIDVNLNLVSGVDFLSLSGHKMHGPKGIGAAFIRKQTQEIYTKITPLLHGGGQENNYRSGTLPVHNIVGMGKAAELAKLNVLENNKKLTALEVRLENILKQKFNEKIKFNHDSSNKIPGLLSIQFLGLNNESLLKKLAPYIALSSGSSCSSSSPSHVLKAVGLSLEEIRQTIRISISSFNTEDELKFFENL